MGLTLSFVGMEILAINGFIEFREGLIQSRLKVKMKLNNFH